ncbi:DNAJ heat shock N-terminal domain-containing protein [Abeliophyllum distichum]|uniref:DNAJ heat shock N-terminal domain-containing protein n=1 Tax=Abeliophyllum distichum TaxID=126358 RepID=A0ABD1U099_9LAMI
MSKRKRLRMILRSTPKFGDWACKLPNYKGLKIPDSLLPFSPPFRKMAEKEDGEAPDAQTTPEEEALFLKNLAEKKYISKSLKSAIKYAKRAHQLYPTLDGLSEMLTAFKILQTAAKPIFETAPESNSASPPDYYKILQVERFSHINTIKKQYKKLALTLHPDKNPFVASEEAFKLVAEAVRVLSDKIRRKEFDMRLRIAMQSEAGEGAEGIEETFWTACSTCRLLHQFEKKYLGHNLMCPRCKKSFKAVEVEVNCENEENVGVDKNVETNGAAPTRISARIRERVKKGGKLGDLEKGGFGLKKNSGFGEVLERSGRKLKRNAGGNVGLAINLRSNRGEKVRNIGGKGTRGKGELTLKRVEKVGSLKKNGDLKNSDGGLIKELSSMKVGGKVRDRGEEVRNIEIEVVESERAKRAKIREEEMMTLAQMQMLVKKKADEEKFKVDDVKERTDVDKEKLKVKENEVEKEKLKVKEKEGEKEKLNLKDKDGPKEKEKENKMVNVSQKRVRHRSLKDECLDIMKRRALESTVELEIEGLGASRKDDLEIMPVEDSDFYDFDKDRRGRSFNKGQVWAVYDDDDGMPRHYALIDEIVSVNPFEVTISWLDFQRNGNEVWTGSVKMGFHVSCGRFKVSRKTSVKYLNMFSHIVDCERAARELYRIYPKKGSVWALYNENTLNAEAMNQGGKDKSSFDIVVCLTSFNDVYGLSMAYLEKVHGFRTIFKRREVGATAIRLLEEDNIKLFSHQIPARKLSGDEASGLPKDCWELDPASLTSQLLNEYT